MARRTTPDEHARAYIAAQAVRELDRTVRGVRLCGECGGEYAPNADGRRRHRMLLDHTPAPAREATS